jgi:hypothetical protein
VGVHLDRYEGPRGQQLLYFFWPFTLEPSINKDANLNISPGGLLSQTRVWSYHRSLHISETNQICRDHHGLRINAVQNPRILFSSIPTEESSQLADKEDEEDKPHTASALRQVGN